MYNDKIVEWSGSILGMVGAAMLASNSGLAAHGFAAFLLSNLFWIYLGVSKKMWGLVVMQLGFTATSVMGIINHW